MPNAPAKPCRHAGCGALVRDGSGYCEKHQADRKVGKWGDERRGSRQSRNYGAEWEAKRKRILRRDKGLCQPHMRIDKFVPAKQVDHIVARAIAQAVGWSESMIEDDGNLQSICVDCHNAKTAHEGQCMREGVGKSLPPPWKGPDA